MLEILDFCSEEFGESGANGVIFIDGPSLVTVRSVQKLLGHSAHFTAVCTLKTIMYRLSIGKLPEPQEMWVRPPAPIHKYCTDW